MVIGTFLGVAALLSQVGDPQELWDTMAAADWARGVRIDAGEAFAGATTLS